jgi:hypothetical protein
MKEDVGHYLEGVWGWVASHTCSFFLALLLEVAMFALFQCFSIFQHFFISIEARQEWSPSTFF